jgi:hypothetical protein
LLTTFLPTFHKSLTLTVTASYHSNQSVDLITLLIIAKHSGIMHLSSITSTLTLALLASVPLASAHGKIAVATGDKGGNGTALGIQGAIIPGAGPNGATEKDTTVFQGKAAASCGKTTGKGKNKIQAGTKAAMALSGSTLPQISSGGFIAGTLHIVTTDGAGPYKALLDTSGNGTFKNAIELPVITQVPGTNGNIKKGAATKREQLWARFLGKRAGNVNEDFPFKFSIPEGVSCTGTVNGQSGVCMVKIVNPSKAGPFGGCVPVQMAGAGQAAAAPAASAAAVSASPVAADAQLVQTVTVTVQAPAASA